MQPQTELLLQQHLRSRRWARLPYRLGLLLAVIVLAPIALAFVFGGVALLFRSIGIH